MSTLQQRLAKVILTDPAVENLSSFIGIDGTNTTLNSGRILINLKPLDERKISASDVIRRLQPRLAEVAGITLFMQPVQDLTVEDRVSRTAVPIHPGRPQRRRVEHLCAENAGQAAGTAGTERCGHRPAGAGPARQAGVRPRHRRAAGNYAIHHRPDPVRRLRPAGSIHHLHAAQPVPRGARSEARVPAESDRSAQPVHPHGRRILERRGGPGGGRFGHLGHLARAGQLELRRHHGRQRRQRGPRRDPRGRRRPSRPPRYSPREARFRSSAFTHVEPSPSPSP